MITTRALRLRSAAVGLAFSGLLALTACGGDDDSSGDSDRTTVVSDDDSGSQDSGDAGSSDDTAGDADSGDADSGDSGSGDVDPLSAEECADLERQFTEVFGGFESSDELPTGDQIEDAFDQLEDNVPDELKADVRTVHEAATSFYEFLDKYDGDFSQAATDPEFAEIAEEFDSEEVTAATDRLDAYFANCETLGES